MGPQGPERALAVGGKYTQSGGALPPLFPTTALSLAAVGYKALISVTTLVSEGLASPRSIQ